MPRGVRQIASSCRRSAAGCELGVAQVRRAMSSAGSSQARQPGRDSAFSSSGVSGTSGMLLPGLIVCGSAIQAASEPRVVGSMPGGDILAPADMGEVGTEIAGRRCSAHRVAGGAGLGQEHVAPGALLRRGGRLGAP